VRAKAVLGRDLRELQARRKQLEHPQVEQVENEVISEDPAELAQISAPQALEASLSKLTAGMADSVKAEDINTEGAIIPEKSSPEPKRDVLSVPFPPASKVQGQVKSHKSLKQSMQELVGAKSQGADADSKIAPGSDTPEAAHGLGITTSSLDPSGDMEAPVSGGLQDTSFDPLFDTGNNGDSELNFDDFDFTGDNANGQNEDFGGNAGEFDLSSFGNQAKTNDGDPGAMLQGLDNFGNGGDGNDFSMLDLSNATTNNQSTDQTAGDDFGMSGGDLEFALNMGANDSSFDDLLNGMDFGDGDNTTAGEMMDHGEFSDAFFSTQ
jgi:hypothetical protein